MLVTSQLTIDLNYRDFNRYLYATQNDGNTRAVEITVLSDRSPWTIPADVVGAVSFKKPDKTAGLYNTLPDGETQAVQFSGNKLTAILAPQVLTAAGDVSVSIVLFDKVLNRLGTFPFTLRVAADPSGGQSVSNDYYAFKTLGELNAAILGHTENKNNPHGVTPAQIGAAPAGYGLGLTSGAYVDDCNMATAFGLYSVSYATENNPLNAYGSLLVLPHNDTEKCQILNSSYNKSILIRYETGGVWGEWEWVNPPMIPGVEYRTTERFDGKPVYAKRIYFGYLPNKTTANVSHGISGKTWNVRYSIDTNWTNQFLGVYPAVTAVYADSTNISIATNSDMSTIVVYFTLWYTKD